MQLKQVLNIEGIRSSIKILPPAIFQIERENTAPMNFFSNSQVRGRAFSNAHF